MFSRFVAKFLVSLGLVSILALVSGCGGVDNTLADGNQLEPQSKPAAFTVVGDVQNEFAFVTNDGVRHNREWLAEWSGQLGGTGSPISFDVPATDEQDSRLDGRISNYYYRIAIDPQGYVSCFKRNVRHFNLLIRNTRTNTLVLDIHLAGWWDNGPQFGIYQSAGNKICARTTGKFTQIRQAIQDVISRMTPLPYWVYVPLAYTVAVVAVGTLALAW